MKAGAGEHVLSRFSRILLRLPKYALLATNLVRDDQLSRGQKAGAAVSLSYALLPIDLLPGIIPVVGQLDDLAVLIGGLRTVVRSLPPEVARQHLAQCGLTREDLDEDLATVRDTAWWLARTGAGIVAGAVRLSSRLIGGGWRLARGERGGAPAESTGNTLERGRARARASRWR